MIRRREFLRLAGLAATLSIAPRIARSASYPTRPVRIVAAFPAGGSADIHARLIGQWLSERLGQPFIVENRPGGGNNIGTEAVIRSPADGYTLLLCVNASAINESLYKGLSFNFLRDTTPVAGIARAPNVLEVTPSFPIKTVPEFIAYAKAHPGKVTMASGGSGALAHIAGELFKMMAGVDLLHVPYKGGAPALNDLIAGHVQVMFDNMPSSIGYIRAGQLRPLAVTTATRWHGLPDLPTIGDFVPGYEVTGWYGVVAPRNTPPEVVELLNKEINLGLADPKMKARIADFGGEPLIGSPQDFGKFLADETEKFGRVVKFSGAKVE